MKNNEPNAYVEQQQTFTRARALRWGRVAGQKRSFLGGQYQRCLRRIYHSLVPSGSTVLELGCGTGGLLDALAPSQAVGVDYSPEMIARGRSRRPHLRFVEADAHTVELNATFDYILMADLLNDVWDVQALLQNVRRMCSPDTRVIINTYSKLWQPVLQSAQSLGLITWVMQQNWLTVDDTRNLLALEDFEIVKHFSDILLPLSVPVLGTACNRYLAKLPLVRHLGLTNVIMARPLKKPWPGKEPSVSVIVPARNEAGHIEEIFQRTPKMGSDTELIFVEGGSSDATYDVIEKTMPLYPESNARLFRQGGKGKGDAVRLGFQEARGDVLMILDADITVPPEDLLRFYGALVSGKAEFVNGVRLVYPMHAKAMRFFNLLGNKFFSLAFSWLLGQSIKDTLCGTKVLSRQSYEKIVANRSYFGEFDPFGDFDLIFGAAKQNLKIMDLPVRYGERMYGDTNIQRWRAGVLLLRMLLVAARRIKFS